MVVAAAAADLGADLLGAADGEWAVPREEGGGGEDLETLVVTGLRVLDDMVAVTGGSCRGASRKTPCDGRFVDERFDAWRPPRVERFEKNVAREARMPAANLAPPRRSAAPGGFSPDLWGPSMWFMVHLVAATYPDAPTPADKANYGAFYRSLQHVLPCPGCAKGYYSIITTDPTRLTPKVFGSRQALFRWTVDVHNRVNAKLRKPVHADWQAWYREYDKLRK